MPDKYRLIKTSPIEQSSALKYIHEIWIKPLLESRPENMTLSAWLNYLFLTHERSIQEYIARVDIKIPGKLMLLPHRIAPLQKKVFRKVRSRSSIWVRTDSTRPNVYEVEATNGVGARVQVFQLTSDEWTQLLPFLKKAPKRRKRTPVLPSKRR